MTACGPHDVHANTKGDQESSMDTPSIGLLLVYPSVHWFAKGSRTRLETLPYATQVILPNNYLSPHMLQTALDFRIAFSAYT